MNYDGLAGVRPPMRSKTSTSIPDQSPLEEAIGREATDRYEAALAALRPEEREAIIGRIELGYTYDELAEALGKPSGDAARKAAERALVRLVEEMTRGAS
jgi:RNA polymerase sigma-70 factor (ECF subfamily)